jgi:WhiB family redox-sensing transcriptional regulator
MTRHGPAPYTVDMPGMGWTERANCRDADPELFHVPSGDRGGQPGPLRQRETVRIRRAKAICGGCPVRAECLEFAMESKDAWAILGGTTPEERKNMRHNENRRARRGNGPANQRAFLDDVEHLVRYDNLRTWNALANRLGVTREAVVRLVQRAGRDDLLDTITAASRVSA